MAVMDRGGRSSDAVAADDYRRWNASRGGGLILCLVVLLLIGVHLPFQDEGRKGGGGLEGRGSKIVNQRGSDQDNTPCMLFFFKTMLKLYIIKAHTQRVEH